MHLRRSVVSQSESPRPHRALPAASLFTKLRFSRSIMKALHTSLLTAALLGVTHTHAFAQCDEYQLPEIPENAAVQMGASVDIGGNLLMFGQPNNTAGSKGALGWKRITGGWVGAFAVNKFSSGDQFGASISVSDSGRVAIGAPKEPNSSGGTGLVAALNWNGTGASYDQAIAPPTTLGYPIEDFGRSVSVSESGEWMVVGAPRTFGSAGCVFLYRLVAGTWVFQQDVYISSVPDEFAYSVAISGTTVVVGSPKFDGPAGIDSGAVFFYSLNVGTATLTQTAMHTGPSAGSELGTTVAIDGVLGAAGGPSFGQDGGAVVFYVNGGGAGGYGQVAGNLLGASIDIDNGNILVGRPGTGVVDRYKLNTSTNLVEYVETFGTAPATQQAGDEFGRAVAIQGEECAVGAPLYDDPSYFTDSGRIMTYENIFDSTTTVNLGHALAGALGAPSLNITGEICAGNIYNITLSNAAPSTTCALIVGFTQIDSKFNGGTLVPFPNVVVVLSTNAAGGINIPAPWPVGLDAAPLIFQWWIADPTGPFGLTSSNGVRTVPPGF